MCDTLVTIILATRITLSQPSFSIPRLEMLEIRDCWSLSFQSRKIRHQRSPSNSSRQPTLPLSFWPPFDPSTLSAFCSGSQGSPRRKDASNIFVVSPFQLAIFRHVQAFETLKMKRIRHLYDHICEYIWDISTMAIYDQIPV